MQDRLLIATKLKKTIEYIEKVTVNYPHAENVLKNKIIDTCYKLLELMYRSNIYKDMFYMKEILVQIRMLEYFIKKSLDKKLINFRKYENIGNHLLELNKMVNAWILSETSK